MLEGFMVGDVSFEDEIELNHSLLFLDQMAKTTELRVVPIKPGDAYKYQGNFYGLLRELNLVNTDMYVFTMYVNGYTSPYAFDGTADSLKIPVKPPIPNK